MTNPAGLIFRTLLGSVLVRSSRPLCAFSWVAKEGLPLKGLTYQQRQGPIRPLMMDGSYGKEYSTIKEVVKYEEVINKSRFIAQAAPVESVDLAVEFVKHISDPKATHNCWAYRGIDTERCSDDGEPGGTAGRPMFQAIEAEELKGVVVVVTRYYGGIKLGTGGLVRAYGGVARECLKKAEREIRTPMVTLKVVVPMELVGVVYNVISKDSTLQREGEEYQADKIVLTIKVEGKNVETLQGALRDSTKGRADITRVSE